MTELPQPTLEQALNDLRPRDTFKVLLQACYNEREALFSELEAARKKEDVMHLAGKITQADKQIYLLTGSNDPMPAGTNGWMVVKPPKFLKRLFKRYTV